MKNKILLIFVGLLAVTALFWNGERIYANWFLPAAGQSAVHLSSLPDHVLYESLFRMDVSFRGRALKQELTGQPVTSLKTYFKDNANLTDEESEILRTVSLDFTQEVRAIDSRAQQIIADVREQFPFGEVPAGREVRPPPAELADLQAQRNELVLRYRDKLSDSLGKGAFEKLEGFVRTDFAANFRVSGEPPRR